LALLLSSCYCQYFVNKLRRKSASQHTQRNVVGQVLVVARFDPPSSRHTAEDNTRVVLTERYWAKGEHVIPIPGSSRPSSARDCAAAADLKLTEEEFQRLDAEKS
jgi:aryl-alcohol dehydrogenase-like predicted oxidoreductase